MSTGPDAVARFRELHASGCFVMPNPWDVGSARALEAMGFEALATTSAGLAWTLGRPDGQATLTGRSEGFVRGRPDIDETIRRLEAYAEAGADCLYAPRITDVDHVQRVVAAVAPKPVNLLVNAPFITVREAAELGVRRISVGGTLARSAWGGWLAAVTEIAEEGTFTRFTDLPDVDGLLGPA